MKMMRIGLVVSALAFAGLGVINCSSSSDSDGDGGSGGEASGGNSGGKGGSSASGGGGGSASGGKGGSSASGGSGGSASGGSGGASGGAGGGAAGGAGGGGGGGGGAAGGAGGAAGGAGGTAAAVTYDGKIKAIFTEKCGGCHTGGGSGGLDLRQYSETQKTGGANCAGKKVGECALARIKAGTMPKDKGCSGNPVTDSGKAACLTKAQQDDLQAWIDGGMKQN
ncbi:MAG: hypothetical protein SF187_16560 [Deltaproteobacteria bacterium]|nr:hypothetical protein [Deltaproteobacteria bacterium]